MTELQTETKVEWSRCYGPPGFPAAWCALETVDLNSVTAYGVYLIWVASRCVYVGQGKIADRLREHRDPTSESGTQILSYRQYGTLGVTWASVDERHCDGVESYLADAFQPLVGSRHPDVPPISVNLP